MDNKTTAEALFCDDVNIQYLAQKMNWNKSISDLNDTVRSFLSNYNGYCTNFTDPWATVRHLNRMFLDSIDKNPSTLTTYSSPAETVLWQEEIYR